MLEVRLWVSRFREILGICKDVSLHPDIDRKKSMNAIRKYGDPGIHPDDILLLIDNTILGSSSQGMFITEERLFAYSKISGKFSIELGEIVTIRPEVRKALAIPIVGIAINEEYFVSLPGMGELLEDETGSQYAILTLAAFFIEALQCELLLDEEPQKEQSEPLHNETQSKDLISNERNIVDSGSSIFSNDNIRFCKKCGMPFVLMPFRDRAKISVAGNIAFFGLGYYFGRKMKKFCPSCR